MSSWVYKTDSNESIFKNSEVFSYWQWIHAYFAESIYNKHLYLEGKQLNLEIYDPCSQVSKTNTLLFYFSIMMSRTLDKSKCKIAGLKTEVSSHNY